MITCKEDLVGKFIVINNQQEANTVIEKCKRFGIEHATWSNCDYINYRNVAKISRSLGTDCSEKLLFASSVEECEDVMDEYSKLEEVLFSSLKQKPTRTEYVKVTDSIFDLRPDFEAGELYFDIGTSFNSMESEKCGEYALIDNESVLSSNFAGGNIYRRIEKEVDWRDAFTPYADVYDGSIQFHSDMTYEQALETCRAALRATGELT